MYYVKLTRKTKLVLAILFCKKKMFYHVILLYKVVILVYKREVVH